MEIYALSSSTDPVLLSTKDASIAIAAFGGAEDVLDAMANALDQIRKFSIPSGRGPVKKADMGPLVDLESQSSSCT